MREIQLDLKDLERMQKMCSDLDDSIHQVINDWYKKERKNNEVDFLLSCLGSVLTTILTSFVKNLKDSGLTDIDSQILEVINRQMGRDIPEETLQ
jgi:signal transduction histidine kinase